MFDLLEPEDVVPAWKRWSPILLRPEGLYGTRPAEGGNKAAKLRAIREALRTAKRVWLATDCDREGQLIGQEILEHYEYRGQVMRVLFTAQDSQTIRDAFGRAKPNAEYARLYAAAVARRQADQIYNLSLTRTATVILGHGARRVIGVGRVKTPTLAIVCKRELEIRNFVPIAYFEVVATAKVAGGQFQMRHAPQDRIVRREIAEAVVDAAQGFEGALAVRVEEKRQGPPKLHDLPPGLKRNAGDQTSACIGANRQWRSRCAVEPRSRTAQPRRCGIGHGLLLASAGFLAAFLPAASFVAGGGRRAWAMALPARLPPASARVPWPRRAARRNHRRGLVELRWPHRGS